MLLKLYIILIIGSFAISMIIFPKFIKNAIRWQNNGQPIREDGPATHLSKRGTPTMGGIVICAVSILIFALVIIFGDNILYRYMIDVGNDAMNNVLKIRVGVRYIAIFLVFILYAVIGFMDDLKKIKSSSSYGLSGKKRLFYEFVIAFIAISLIKTGDIWIKYSHNGQSNWENLINFIYMLNISEFCNNSIILPLGFSLNIGWLYYIFAPLVIVAAANSVNLTDGLDGLVTMPIIMNMIYLSIFSIIMFYPEIAKDYLIYPVTGALGVSCFAAIIVGSCLAFLWFNTKPAKIFMGDVGSLSLGGGLGIVAVSLGCEIAFFFSGLLFVIEALSVIIQVFSYRTRGKRVFLMAPIHHHFEKLGWSESIVVSRFWIFSILCVLLSAILYLA